MDLSIWDAAGPSLLGLAPDVDTHWLGQLDQTNLLGGFDFSAILGSGGGQDALHGDSLSTHGPFGSDSGLSTSGMNPLQPLSHDLFAGINGVYSGVSPADSGSSNADQSDRDRLKCVQFPLLWAAFVDKALVQWFPGNICSQGTMAAAQAIHL